MINDLLIILGMIVVSFGVGYFTGRIRK